MWNLLKNNFSCSEIEAFKENKIHLEKLISIKSNINNKANEVPLFLKNKTYLRELKRNKERNINLINNLMDNKLKSVSKSPSIYSKKLNNPKYCPAFDKRRFNFSKIERERQISTENKSFYKRFNERKATYSTKKLLKKSYFEDYLKSNISKKKFLPKINLQMCTFKEFKSHLFEQTQRLRKLKTKWLNETKLPDKSRTINVENSKSINNPLSLSLSFNNNLRKKDIYEHLKDKKFNYLKNKAENVKHIKTKKRQFQF